MPPRLRTLLVLGRVSNLPTVWSNCLAGWWLGGGGHFGKLPLLLLGVSALYCGGMFLNDAFDADVDRQRHPTRPIPSGAITRETVWVWSIGLLAAGVLLLSFISKTAGILALALLASIFIFDATHKAINVSPWLMGLCRFWVYLIAGATGVWGVNGWPIWCGAALAIYVAGLNSMARREGFRGPLPVWPLLLLLVPVLLALLMNAGEARNAALLLSLVLGLWLALCLRTIFLPGAANVRRIASGLLTGIIFVDWLAVAPLLPHWMSTMVFGALFGATLFLQRFAPAA